jgi:hypothetical protein
MILHSKPISPGMNPRGSIMVGKPRPEKESEEEKKEKEFFSEEEFRI